jgi:NADH:ubiquinone oxidoreductase subunit 4 (subunit M)
MNELALPWLELAVAASALGAVFVGRLNESDLARIWSLVFSGVSLLFVMGAWLNFQFVDGFQAADGWQLARTLFGRDVFVLDQFNAPLLVLVALLHFLTTIATLRTKIRRFSFAWTLAREAIMLATFSCQDPWLVILFTIAGTLPPYVELRARGQPTRIYAAYMGLFAVLLVVGWMAVEHEGKLPIESLWTMAPLLVAIMIRSGIAPFHSWVPDLFEHATFGTALLFVAPVVGAYAAVRLVLPIASDSVLHTMGLISLVTAVYAAGMALVQTEARRFFCYLFLSHSALVLVGLNMATPLGLTGALCVWLSMTLALGGLGLTLRALEGRCGRLSLADFQGLYEHTPNLAMCFVLTGLASVGFPGTFGFVGGEVLVDGAVETYPYVGIAVVLASALNGIAIVKAYFLLFTGRQYFSTISLKIRVRERYAVLTLAALILIGGLIPQPGVLSRHYAADEILKERAAITGAELHTVERKPWISEDEPADL